MAKTRDQFDIFLEKLEPEVWICDNGTLTEHNSEGIDLYVNDVLADLDDE